MALARLAPHDETHPLDLAAFSASIAGTVIRPEDAGYDLARQVHNARIGRHPTRIREAYPEATYRRLAEVKCRYDPTNLFRLNQNIRPATGF